MWNFFERFCRLLSKKESEKARICGFLKTLEPFLLFPLISFLLVLNPCLVSAADEPIKIGIIASLTGPAGEMGKNWSDGARLAAEELNQDHFRVKLAIEDDQTSPAKTVSAFQRLAQVEKVKAILGGTWDFIAQAAFPLAEKYRNPFFTPSNPPELLLEAAPHNKWIFSNSLSLEAEAKAIREFIEKEKISSVALVYPNIPFGETHADIIRNLEEEGKVSIVLDDRFPLEGVLLDSLKSAALKVTQKKPDLVYVITDYQGIDNFFRELSTLGYSQKVLTSQHLDQAFLFSKNRKLYEGGYADYPEVHDKEFEARFAKRFGYAPKVFAAHGYDALKFAVKALQERVQFDAPQVPFKMMGITGEHVLPPLKGRAVTESTAVMMTTKRGIFERLYKSP